VTLSIRSKASRDVDGSIAPTAIHARRAKKSVLGMPLGGEDLARLVKNSQRSKDLCVGRGGYLVAFSFSPCANARMAWRRNGIW
jgi:hypothetical protein